MSFSYTSHDGFIFIGGVSLTHPVLASFFIWGVSLTHPLLVSCFFLSGEFLLHIPCWLHLYLGSFPYTSRAVSSSSSFFFFFFFYLGSFSYTSHDGFTFLWGVSLTHPVLAFFFFLIWGVSLTHPMLDLFFSREFLVHIHC